MVRGETKKLTITVVNKTTKLPVDCSGASGILIGAYHEGGKLIAQWSKVSKTGFGIVDITDAATGILVVYLSASQTIDSIRQRKLKLEVEVAFPNSNYPANLQISIDTAIDVEEIENSIFEGISPV